mmetsp:Transcript_12299/g.13447  ORF Transcript_12299/g.13447 Transcript_12299/m.13447 type:complete len:142 (-) Transcript_12299:452-877(-)|eukprot:CAMPEP_0114994804 /NCGR_PEP_ID=MMETSP0216-20121206/13350_1 /TAXON_ID=223996 /ORGANISM="Protocruzia adherens, Strain Boccale" /LENGTH=141 /DNA_ID=CAMNT_0002358721 /DNA_START=1338 /DNA_END=1763 /DNA_ORIENTATION=+
MAPKTSLSYIASLSQRSSFRSKPAQQRVLGSLPVLSPTLAKLCLVLNALLPGSGTILSSLKVIQLKPAQEQTNYLALGFYQLFATIFVVGWFWSVIWGCNLVALSKRHSRKRILAEHSDADVPCDLECPLLTDDSSLTNSV